MTNYPSLSDYKSFKSITSNAEDNSLQLFLSSAIERIEREAGFSFPLKEYVEFPDTKGKEIVLNNWFITEITEVALDLSRSFTSPTIISPSTFTWKKEGIIKPDTLYEGSGIYRIKYKSGFTNIPSDIIQLIYETIDFNKLHFKQGIGIRSYSSDSLGNVQNTFSESSFNKHFMDVIRNYK